MKRAAFGPVVLCSLVALLATACPGQKPAQAPVAAPPAAAPDNGPLVWKLSKSGLGFRLSNADEDGDRESEHKAAPSTPLGADDTRKIVARLPELKREPDDAKDFSMRDRSIPPPRPGKRSARRFRRPAVRPPRASRHLGRSRSSVTRPRDRSSWLRTSA